MAVQVSSTNFSGHTANEVYKVSASASGGGVMNVLTDLNGVSRLIWEKIG